MALSDGVQITIGLVLLAGVYVLTRVGVARRMSRAGRSILAELEKRGAVDALSAVRLPYDRTDWLSFGLRDYRPQALKGLVQSGAVGRTDQGGYHLVRAGADGAPPAPGEEP